MISLVFAMGNSRQFGTYSGLPWPHIKEDMQKFKQITSRKTVVMGSKTFGTLPSKLTERLNVVLSKNKQVVAKDGSEPDIIIHDMDSLEDMIYSNPDADWVIIGGKSMLNHFVGVADEVHMTIIDHEALLDNEYCDVVLDSDFIEYIVSNFNNVVMESILNTDKVKVVYNQFIRPSME